MCSFCWHVSAHVVSCSLQPPVCSAPSHKHAVFGNAVCRVCGIRLSLLFKLWWCCMVAGGGGAGVCSAGPEQLTSWMECRAQEFCSPLLDGRQRALSLSLSFDAASYARGQPQPPSRTATSTASHSGQLTRAPGTRGASNAIICICFVAVSACAPACPLCIFQFDSLSDMCTFCFGSGC